jgi:hypothetical protein
LEPAQLEQNRPSCQDAGPFPFVIAIGVAAAVSQAPSSPIQSPAATQSVIATDASGSCLFEVCLVAKRIGRGQSAWACTLGSSSRRHKAHLDQMTHGVHDGSLLLPAIAASCVDRMRAIDTGRPIESTRHGLRSSRQQTHPNGDDTPYICRRRRCRVHWGPRESSSTAE